MRAGLRLGIAAFFGALTLAPVPVLAQEAAPPATNTTTNQPSDTIGPRELENFSLNGTVTRPAPTAPAPRATPAPTTTRPTPDAVRPSPSAPAGGAARSATADNSAPPASTPEPLPPATEPVDLSALTPAEDTAVQRGFDAVPVAAPVQDGGGNVLPWLLALGVLGVGAGLYFFRQRSGLGYATAGASTDAFVAPDPAPSPQPLERPPPPRPVARTAETSGIVSSRLRPWLEIEFSPGRCVVEDDKATIQFDVAVYNSGAAPARDVLIEASMFNAGPAQDQEISAFFAHPMAKGDRIPAIPPLKRVALKSAVSLTREQMRQYEVEGRKLFVPLIGFNALYRWGGGEGQTSASYLVGRDTQSDKMAPLRLDLGPRIFRGLGARRHNVGVRR